MSDKFNFTVETLIKALKDLPHDMPVLVNGYNSGYENMYHPEIVTLIHEQGNRFEDGEFQPVAAVDGDVFNAVVLGRVNRYD